MKMFFSRKASVHFDKTMYAILSTVLKWKMMRYMQGKASTYGMYL